ncbi:MAG: RidA family protein [Candidatus Omnitrophota bacterium]
MKKKIFYSKRAPSPKGPYSQAAAYNGILYISGQLPVDPATDCLVPGTIEDQTRRVLENLKAIARDAGAELGDVLKTTCYLADLNDFGRFNTVYAEYFSNEPPARATVQAARLPLDAKLEIDAVVKLPSHKR